MEHLLTEWKSTETHASITELAKDFVTSLHDERSATNIIDQVKTKYRLQGKFEVLAFETLFQFLV